MSKFFKAKTLAITAIAILALTLLGSCKAKVEYGETTATLRAVLEDALIVEDAESTTEFITNADTKYYLGGDKKISIDDVVDIKYHTQGKKKYADRVSIIKYAHYEQTYKGVVSNVNSYEFTLTGESMSVEFVYNASTKINGKLNKGDEVEVVYSGNISEYPYASEVRILKENNEPETAKINGIISEFSETSMQVSIDSATSYRFTLNKDTRITGVAKYLRVGDSVNVTYSGELKKGPIAKEVNIVKEAEPEKRKVNGTIKEVQSDYVVLNTDKNSYIIKTDKDTKYTGEKPAKGLKSEITYTGNLSSGKALATNIYCAKAEVVYYKVKFMDGNGNTIKTDTVEKGHAAKAPADPKRDGYTFKGWDKDFSKVMSNLTVTATWVKNPTPKPKATYTVTFEDGQGHVINEQHVEEGKAAIAPDDPTREGYTFAGWDKDFSNITSDLTVMAQWEKNPDPKKTYHVIFTDGIGNTLDEQDVEEGGEAVAPPVPNREGYEFIGWDKEFGHVTSDLTVNAMWKELPKPVTTYHVVFTDGNGNIYDEQDVEEGSAAVAPDVPSREGFEFTGWDADFSNVTSDLTVNATWKEIESEPAPEPEPDPEPAPEPEPEPEPEQEPVPEEEVIVTAQGVISEMEIDEVSKNVKSYKIKVGEQILELKTDKNTKIAGGYFPAKGDKIEIKYTKSDMLLKEIKLLEKAAAPAETGGGEKQTGVLEIPWIKA